MTAGGLVPVIPQRSADARQYDPPPPGGARPAYNDQLASRPRPVHEVAPWPVFDGSHGIVPDGPSLDDPGMEPFPMYSPSLSAIAPVSDFWDHGCECP